MGTDHALFGQRLEIDYPFPKFAAEQQDRQLPDLAGLDQGQKLEQFVERSKPAGEDRNGAGAQQEMHFPQREIMELET